MNKQAKIEAKLRKLEEKMAKKRDKLTKATINPRQLSAEDKLHIKVKKLTRIIIAFALIFALEVGSLAVFLVGKYIDSRGDGPIETPPIVDVSSGVHHIVGLTENGTVVAVGENDDGECNVEYWKNIVAISAGGNHTVGLKKDGTVVACGNDDHNQCFGVRDWEDIVAISAGDYHTVGLKKDGTVVAVGDNDYDQCEVENWTDIIAIAAGNNHTVGLKSNGTVVAVGDNLYEQCNVEGLNDIVDIAAGMWFTAVLKKDGTVLYLGLGRDESPAEKWTGIVKISSESTGFVLVGQRDNGTVVLEYDNDFAQKDLENALHISLGNQAYVVLKKDGTVVVRSDGNRIEEEEVKGWGALR